jgi:replicative DNA helicase
VRRVPGRHAAHRARGRRLTEAQIVPLAVPPHSAEAEQAVIGALLLRNDAYDRVSWLKPEAFYVHGHRLLWTAISSMLEQGKPADVVTVCEAMGAEIDKAGGPTYLASLAQSTPSATNIHRYAEVIRDRSIFRTLHTSAMQIAEKAITGVGDARDLAEEAEVAFLAVLDTGKTASDFVHIGQAATEYVEWQDNHPKGIETGLADLDSLTGGLLPGNLVVIAGRTHMGKTALALQLAEHICEKTPGMMFSLEASRREVAGRMIEWHRHRLGRDGAVDKVFNLSLFVDDSASMSPWVMRARLRRMKRQHGVALIVVDYLQLVRGKGDSREQEVAFISRELKAIARDFEVPLIALSQLNRKVEDRTDKRPHMSDLRESGAIEQDADLIMLLYRPDYYDQKFEGSTAEAEILVAKNRNTGRSGTVKVTFSRDLGRFGDFIPERYRGVA